MYKCSLNLNDAFNLVRSRKSNIAPNFHFMEQLHSFERELKLDVSSCSPNTIFQTQITYEPGGQPDKKACAQCGKGQCKCRKQQSQDFLSPLAHIGVSPDSGIEFDRWASSTPGGE